MIFAVAGYEAYIHTIGRPLEVETATATLIAGAEPRPLISGSGYVVTRDKYITVGTKILGQIIEEPIEEGVTYARATFSPVSTIATISADGTGYRCCSTATGRC